MTSTGGNPGLADGTTNAQIAMMAALGPCGDLSYTYINLNEVTTVAAVASLAPYLQSYSALGSGVSDSQNMADAFTMAGELANVGTGSTPGINVPAGQTVASQKLNSLANILSGCVNSAGGKAGDASRCGLLFSLATPQGANVPTDTVGALVNIAKNPTSNVVPIFDLGSPTAPFQPSLTSAPSDWNLGLTSSTPTPVFSPLPGTTSAPPSITLTDSDSAAAIYYTTDGSVPTSSATLYTGAFTLSATSTVRAIAIAGGISSLLAAGTYTVSPQTLGLVFLTTPASVMSGAAITPALRVVVEDQNGVVNQNFTGQVTVGFASDPTNSALTGTLSVPAVSGVATFSNVVIAQPGSGYQLAASGPGLTGAVSASFAATASASLVTVTPASVNVAPSQTQAFVATASNGSAVTWAISPAAGSISATGLYTAPATVPSTTMVTVTATSVANPSQTASAVVTIAPAIGATYYLASASGGGSDVNTGLTAASPWLTPNHPLNCGDTILAAPGTSYDANNFATGQWGNVTCSGGQAVAWLKCATFDGCKISTSTLDGMHVSASNWGVQGWEVTTTGGGGGGCFTAQPTSRTVSLHHVIFANDIANGCEGSGFNTYDFGTAGVDYLSLVGNIVYQAAQGSGQCFSGISIYEPIKYDSLPGTHIYVAGNIVWDNVDPNQCGGSSPTDGEGILFDTFDGSQTSGYVPYTQQAVMTNNITVGNGNSGVKVYQNDVGTGPFAQLYMTHNTTWGNTAATNESGSECAEVMLIATTNTQVYGNLSVPVSGTSCGGNPLYAYYVVSSPTTTNSIYGNWAYSPTGNNGGIGGGSTGFSFGTGNVFGTNPLLANPSIPGAPNCSTSSSVPNCMATAIANFAPKNAAAVTYGYQTPSPVGTYDPLFPQWLCNVTLPSGLVTMGCNTGP